MDLLDIVALSGLEWLYDRVEGRYGRGAAWLVTVALALSILGLCVWVLVVLLRR